MTPILACESLRPGNGGVGRVARLIARVLSEERTGQAEAIALSDDVPESAFGLPVHAARGSRMQFVGAVARAAMSHSHFIYDFLGMARAHCPLPLLRRPFMTFLHGIEVWENGPSSRIRAARRAAMLIANSAYTRARADRVHGGMSRARVCWLATETDDPAPEPAASPPCVLIVGRLEEPGYKGHAELVDCWPRVRSAVPQARLLIAGGGPGLGAMRRRATDGVDVLGFVPEPQMESVWSQASIFAMPSRGEGFGLVYIEAMRHGLPVVASIHDAAPEVNLQGVTGLNVDLDAPGRLADALVDLLRNPAAAAAMGARGRERWQRCFRFSAFRDRFRPMLREFLSA